MTDSFEIEQLARRPPRSGSVMSAWAANGGEFDSLSTCYRRENSATVVLDFTEVPYVDSAGWDLW